MKVQLIGMMVSESQDRISTKNGTETIRRVQLLVDDVQYKKPCKQLITVSGGLYKFESGKLITIDVIIQINNGRVYITCI